MGEKEPILSMKDVRLLFSHEHEHEAYEIRVITIWIGIIRGLRMHDLVSE